MKLPLSNWKKNWPSLFFIRIMDLPTWNHNCTFTNDFLTQNISPVTFEIDNIGTWKRIESHFLATPNSLAKEKYRMKKESVEGGEI